MESENSSGDDGSLVFICVDESEHSIRAFEWFHNNFYREDHVIGLVHVFNSPVSQHANKLADVETDYAAKREKVMQKTSCLMQEYLDKCKEFHMRVKVLSKEKTESESVGRTICHLVKELNPVCVVIGQRGLGAVKRTLYGSVSEFVLHHAHVPVLIVPPPK